MKNDFIMNITLDDPLATNILFCWEKYKHNKFNITKDGTCTNNGIQTSNVLELLDFKEDNIFQECLNNILQNIKNLLGLNLYYCWVHFVEYFEGGYQDIHNHKHNEDYSFVLYLNTCSDGETYFNVEPPISILPNKNNMILFSSNIDHGAKTCYNKKVLVGGLRRYS